MVEMTSYAPGTFCWVDLATPDPEAAKAFYGTVFGWSSEDLPTDAGGPYTMLSHEGRQACGLYRPSPEQGPTPCWSSYLSVSDVDAATRLGGAVLMGLMEIEKVGRFAYLRDPQGAAFAVIQRSGE